MVHLDYVRATDDMEFRFYQQEFIKVKSTSIRGICTYPSVPRLIPCEESYTIHALVVDRVFLEKTAAPPAGLERRVKSD